MIIFWIILLIAVMSWREVQILIDRGSWKAEDHLNIFWYTNQNNGWVKNWDSFHVSNGLFTLVLIYVLYANNILPDVLYVFCQVVTDTLHIIAYWLIWMQIRNLFITII